MLKCFRTFFPTMSFSNHEKHNELRPPEYPHLQDDQLREPPNLPLSEPSSVDPVALSQPDSCLAAPDPLEPPVSVVTVKQRLESK